MTTPGPIAEETSTTFRQDCRVTCEIEAPPERIWSLLTDAKRFPAWNSTVTSLDGTIALGEKLALKVPIAPEPTFTPKVTKLEPPSMMEWSDGFAPMKSLPDFGPAFEAFARYLKTAAEGGQR